ncbi:MAG: sel1 repeat family protein [Oscillospiraceae bacterium]|nr:sel1 repeat family protein [Oscillospiraceae bacterium]
MARLIVKSPYIKGGGKGGYAKYIATRDGVELLPSGYMEYMAQRPRSHGLFGDQDAVDLTSAIREINEYPGNIWTHIISLKREDAERLGYDHAPQWRNLLRTHRNDIATAMHIPPQDFRWYAAFHDEGDHPHVHMMVWSVKPGQAYLSREGIQKIKFVLTNDIFQQEMLHTYEQKSASRDELVRESRRVMEELTRQMEDGICDSPEMELLMQTLVIQLETAKGKKKYGYLPPKTKETVRRIVDQLELLSVVNKCYQTWWELQCEIEDYYTERQRERPKLSEQKEFRSILNAVIQEADNIRLGVVTFEDREMNDEVEEEELNDEPQNLWQLVMAYQEARAVLYDEDAGWSEQEEAVQTLELLWNEGLTVAAHQLGKCYRDGLAVIPDDEQAEAWFLCSAQAGKDYSQYALGKLLQEQRRIIEAVEWYNQASAQGNQYADYRLGKFYLTGKEIPKDVAEAIRHLTASAEAGNQYAKYTLGKLYLMGQDIPQDREQAFYWFTQSAEQGNEYAQFFLDRWDTTGSPSVMLSVTRLLHRIAQTFREAPSPRDATTIQPHMDRKRLEQLREKKLAMGHRLDDYGSYDFTMGGMSM